MLWNTWSLQRKLREAHDFVMDYMQNNDTYACFKSAKHTKEVG